MCGGRDPRMAQQVVQGVGEDTHKVDLWGSGHMGREILHGINANPSTSMHTNNN